MRMGGVGSQEENRIEGGSLPFFSGVAQKRLTMTEQQQCCYHIPGVLWAKHYTASQLASDKQGFRGSPIAEWLACA